MSMALKKIFAAAPAAVFAKGRSSPVKKDASSNAVALLFEIFAASFHFSGSQ